MTKTARILRISFIFLLIILASGCSPTRKNTYYAKRRKASHVNSERIGRNRYFFSPEYQKKLNKNFKKKRVKY